MLAVGLTAAMALGAAQAQAQTNNSNTMSPPAMNNSSGNAAGMAHKASKADQHFLTEAMQGDMAEVQMGKLAQQKAGSDQVKQFGTRMVDDHSKANDDLKQVASSKGIPLPSALDSEHKSKMAKLEKLSGAQFDRAYMDDMVSDHKKDVAEFEKQAKSGNDADIKGFASKTLPTLQQHLSLAESTDKAVKGGK